MRSDDLWPGRRDERRPAVSQALAGRRARARVIAVLCTAMACAVIGAPGVSSAAAPSPKRTAAPKTTPKATTSACKRTVRVMPLGDSLTSFAESYRGPLFRSLSVGGPKVDFVGSGYWDPEGGGDPHHEGHGGYTIGPATTVDFDGNKANLADNIAKWVTAAKPDVIILAIGTNDVAFGATLAGPAPSKLRALVTELRRVAPSAVIVTSDIPPTGSPAKATPEISAINAAAKAAAVDTKLALHAPTFDRLLAAGYDPARHTGDGTHFTAEGGRMYAEAFLPTVRQAIRQSAPCR